MIFLAANIDRCPDDPEHHDNSAIKVIKLDWNGSKMRLCSLGWEAQSRNPSVTVIYSWHSFLKVFDYMITSIKKQLDIRPYLFISTYVVLLYSKAKVGWWRRHLSTAKQTKQKAICLTKKPFETFVTSAATPISSTASIWKLRHHNPLNILCNIGPQKTLPTHTVWAKILRNSISTQWWAIVN